jgi:pimeloyl-ACP methyl ester carboxylesterase
MIKYPAADAANRIGSLFLNPGGPGGSGIDLVLGAPPQAFALFPKFDIVSFDPRGVGVSRPAVDCTTDEEDDASVGGYLPRPHTVDEDAMVEAGQRYMRQCFDRNPEILPYLSTANVARDLDLMRAAVHDRRLNFIGISHGAHIGAAYMTLFPGRGRAMVMDSPVDPDVWDNRPIEGTREQLTGFDNALDRFFMACAVHQDVCGFGGNDPEVAFDALVAAMNEHPVEAPNSTFHEPVTGDEVLAAAGHVMYRPTYWAPFAEALVAAEQGDASLMRDLVSSFSGRHADGTWDPTGVFDFTRHQDGLFPAGHQPYFDEGRHSYVYSPHTFGWSWHWFYAFLGDNPVPKNDPFRGPFRNPSWAEPALVIGGTHDPATPYRWAERYVEQLGNARLVTYESDGHGALGALEPCVAGLVADYVETLRLPAEGTTCTQTYEPFGSGADSSTPSVVEGWGAMPMMPRTVLR